jgi:drug/metabolite transporter (DMT)-like permease
MMLIIFKYFELFKVNNLQAIIVNYFTAGFLAIALDNNQSEISLTKVLNADYIPQAFVIGVLFIITFNLVAYGTQKIGIAITTVANKMSMIIPVLAGLFLFNEDKDLIKIAGVLLAVFAIYYSSTKNGKLSFDKKYLLIIILIFIGQGLADSTLKWAQEKTLNESNNGTFFASTFIIAALMGSLFLIYETIKGQHKFKLKNILWGIILGIPNYFTLYFFVKALSSDVFQSSQIFPIVNMGVIIITAISGIILFKEQLSRSNWLGILLAVVAISLITFTKEIMQIFY